MGDTNQEIYLKKFMPEVEGAVLEIGSKDYGNTSSFRDFYNKNEYIGVDLEAGKNVDVVTDLTEGIAGLKVNYFALGICCSVLEHVKQPWKMADNLTSLIKPGGALYISVPWVWAYHPYPDDYFRFSWKGIIELFPDFNWKHICYSTNSPGELIEIKEGDEDNKLKIKKRFLTKKRRYLPFLMINMLGVKKTD